MALIDAGPGDLSADALLGRREWGPGWALGGLAVGAAASAAAIALGRRGGGAARAPQGAVAAATTDQRAGDEFGLLKDQFGIHWMLNISRSTTS